MTIEERKQRIATIVRKKEAYYHLKMMVLEQKEMFGSQTIVKEDVKRLIK